MPVKRRTAKRRIGEAAELAAWSGAFDCEFDFFGDLETLGLTTDSEVREAMPEAWERLGGAFLASGMSTVPDGPWALRALGKPGGGPCRALNPR